MNEFIYEEISLDSGNKVIKRTDADGKEWWIPTDPANSDYQQYLVWLEAQTPKTTSKAAAN